MTAGLCVGELSMFLHHGGCSHVTGRRPRGVGPRIGREAGSRRGPGATTRGWSRAVTRAGDLGDTLTLMPDQDETRFARIGDVHIAYQIVGDGPIDILFVDTWVHHVEAVWDFPDFARLLRRLSSFGRLIHFDRRGTGLSDPVPLDRLPDFDTQVEDVIAVLDAAGSERPAIVGTNDGTLVAMLLAAAHPDRCRSLVLFAPTAQHVIEEGQDLESIEDVVTMIAQSVDDSGLHWLAPSRVGDDAFDRRLLKLQRFSVRQGAMGHYYRQTLMSDVTDVIPQARVPDARPESQRQSDRPDGAERERGGADP